MLPAVKFRISKGCKCELHKHIRAVDILSSLCVTHTAKGNVSLRSYMVKTLALLGAPGQETFVGSQYDTFWTTEINQQEHLQQTQNVSCVFMRTNCGFPLSYTLNLIQIKDRHYQILLGVRAHPSGIPAGAQASVLKFPVYPPGITDII